MGKFSSICVFVPLFLIGCEVLDNDPEKHASGTPVNVSLEEVARLLSVIPVGEEQLEEVYDAVTSSAENGYDEEYMMKDLFSSPGSGVGDDRIPGTKSPAIYDRPLRDLIRDYVTSEHAVKSSSSAKAGRDVSPEDYMAALESSDIQIYWPFSENWDGKSMPVITFDPGDGSTANVGYRLSVGEDGSRVVEEVVVDEEFAAAEPVWVVNRNDDSGYESLEMLRRENPEWGSGGGSVIIRPRAMSPDASSGSLSAGEKAGAGFKTLILKDFTMKRNYDPWFAGASEFFVKIGSIEDFTASTEAELRLYSPTVTDFMIVVKRNQVGKPQPFNAVLVSEWTDQLTHCAFMIIEDDGGTKTTWTCTALVRVASKSYGVEVSFPLNRRDDIVWRGQLSSKYLMANDNTVGHFGDVDLTFEFIEY